MEAKTLRHDRTRRSNAGLASSSAVRSDVRFVLVLLCFLLSGFAGLLYETVWTQQFASVFGTSELAVATVLAGYFAGLALGAALAARWVARVRRPLLSYGLLELGIAAGALAMPLAIGLARRLYVAWFSGDEGALDTGGLTTVTFYLACSFLSLLIPTAMMGATLPMLARFAVREDRQLGPRVGLLYAVNTIGAVGGVLVAAFVLLPALGLMRTIWVGVAVNLFVFGLAALLAIGESAPSIAKGGTQPRSAGDDAAVSPPARRAQWILPLMLVSGGVSFTYEVLWTRLLGHILGDSVYAFSTMLASFLLGIALGSAFATRWTKSAQDSRIGFCIAQIGTALLSLAAYVLIDRMPEFARSIGAGASGKLATNALVAAMILLPGALCIGATFPFAVRLLACGSADAGPASARVYAWNTIGAIAGSVATGFWLLPMLQFSGTLTAAIHLNLVIGVVCMALCRPWPRKTGMAAALVLLGLALVGPTEPWSVLRTSALGRRSVGGEVTSYAVGRAATVLLVDDGIGWDLRTNGLPEASIRRRGAPPGRVAIQQWQNALPVLARPKASSMLFIGMGGGVAIEQTPSSITQIDVVEIEPEVIAANRAVALLRAIDPLADPRVRLHINDARNALLLSNRQFDIIVSQPSHPWTAGASHLYTREFMQRVKDCLTPDGVFLQWMSLSFVDESLYRSLLATMTSVFDEVEVYAPYPGAVLMLGSAAPIRAWESAEVALAAAQKDFTHAAILSAEDVLAALELDSQAARRFAADSKPITDDFNRLQLSSRRSEEESISSWKMTEAAFAPTDPATLAGSRWARTYLVNKVLMRGNVARATRIADATTDPVQRQLGGAWIDAWRGDAEKAASTFDVILMLNPTSSGARYGLVRARAAAFLRGERALVGLAESSTDPEKAIFEGWQLSATQAWPMFRGLEARLARMHPLDDWYVDAQRLRAKWRIATGDNELALEAVDILGTFLQRFGAPEDYVQLADAYEVLGNPVGVLGAVHEAVMLLRPTAASQGTARLAQRKLDALPPELANCEAARRAGDRLRMVMARAE